jgi:hypothetical protein
MAMWPREPRVTKPCLRPPNHLPSNPPTSTMNKIAPLRSSALTVFCSVLAWYSAPTCAVAQTAGPGEPPVRFFVDYCGCTREVSE